MIEKIRQNPHSPFYLLFFFSGISGLIYESVWAKYLKLFLGHSSYGQLLTLCIYMGGLGLGSFIAGKFSSRLKNPLLGYAVVELLISSSGFLFHPLYKTLTEWFYHSELLPSLNSWQIESLKIFLSISMTLPFAILLGMTFPWMVAGLMRRDQDHGQKAVAGLYYFNAGGAMVGILFASFILVPKLGVAGALQFAAVMNALLGGVVFFFNARLPKKESVVESLVPKELEKKEPKIFGKEIQFWLLLSFLTGLTSFIYEIVWIRMLSLMLGSSTHSFDLMVSAFIAGLAWGSFSIRKKMQSEKSWSFLLARAQWMMGMAALGTIVFYPLYFKAMNEANQVFQQTGQAYVIWSWFRYLLCLGWMVPTSFFAGQTLPLITCLLHQKTGDEGYTGKVYGWNTMGAILGASAAGLFLMPVLGLKGSLWVAGTFDVLTGVAVWLWYTDRQKVPGIGLILAGCAVFATLLVPIDQQMITAGMFRGHKSLQRRENMTIAHGRTATISFHETAVHKYIKTNGKPDASISKDKDSPLGSDQLTQAGTAFYPMLTFHEPYTAAVVGFGSGMSVDYLLADPLLQSIDLIEIEEQMVELAKGFLPDNQRAFDDERMNFIYDDARTYFHTEQKKYDLILSVPSNPWVSGVSSLFTKEFYGQVNRFLSEKGLLVQWIQLYEFNSSILFTILNTLDRSFDCVKFYVAPGGSDLLLLAGKECKELDIERFKEPALAAELKKMKHAPAMFSEKNFLVTGENLRPFLKNFPVNSDFDPQVDYFSEEARFKSEYASFFEGFHSGYLSYKEIFSGNALSAKYPTVVLDEEFSQSIATESFKKMAERDVWSEEEKRLFSEMLFQWLRDKALIEFGAEQMEWLGLLKEQVQAQFIDEPAVLVEFHFFYSLLQNDLQSAYVAAKLLLQEFYPHTLNKELLRAIAVLAIKNQDQEMLEEVVNKGLQFDEEVDVVELDWLRSFLEK